MKDFNSFTRRKFMQTSLAVASAYSASDLQAEKADHSHKSGQDPFRGLKVGVASYSLRKFSLDEAIEMTQKLGVRYITLKDFHLPRNSSKVQRQEARKKIEGAGLILMGGGVINMKNDEAEIRSAFEYAKDAGMPLIVASPEPNAMDVLEKVVKDYDIRVAIHNHGPEDQKKFPSPYDVMQAVKNRDKRIGLCMDIGHTMRIGLDPVSAVKRCASRLYDMHFKDVTAATPEGKNIEVGRGIIHIASLLKAVLDIRFTGHVALEYEINETNPLPGMAESLAYTRGVLAALRT